MTTDPMAGFLAEAAEQLAAAADPTDPPGTGLVALRIDGATYYGYPERVTDGLLTLWAALDEDDTQADYPLQIRTSAVQVARYAALDELPTYTDWPHRAGPI